MDDIVTKMEALQLGYRAERCYYVSELLMLNQKFNDAASLFIHTMSLTDTAIIEIEEASAEDLETRGFISMIIIRPSFGSTAN